MYIIRYLIAYIKCSLLDIRDFSINRDGSIDIHSNVLITKRLNIKINRVFGDLRFQECYFKNMKYMPSYIDGSLIFISCEIKSFKGFPEYIGGNVRFSWSNMSSLKDIKSNTIIQILSCPDLYDITDYPSNGVVFFNSPYDFLPGSVTLSKEKMELFKDMKVVVGNTLYINRLNDFLILISRNGEKHIAYPENYNNKFFKCV